MTMLYLHGFNSDGGGFKYEQLSRYFDDFTIIAPDLAANPLEVVQQVHQLLPERPKPLCLVGTSLGGFYALHFSALLNVPCFLYNPSLQPHLTLHRGIGQHETFIKGRPYHFKATYLPMLEKLKMETDANLRQQNLNFFLATNDEVLDLNPIPTLFPCANHLSWHADVGHGFSKFKKTLPIVRLLLEGYGVK